MRVDKFMGGYGSALVQGKAGVLQAGVVDQLAHFYPGYANAVALE